MRSRNGKAPERIRERNVEVEVRVENRMVDGDTEEDVEGGANLPERLLDEAPLDVQEAWICEDLLFVLQVGPMPPKYEYG